jgi:hypothetical protein
LPHGRPLAKNWLQNTNPAKLAALRQCRGLNAFWSQFSSRTGLKGAEKVTKRDCWCWCWDIWGRMGGLFVELLGFVLCIVGGINGLAWG